MWPAKATCELLMNEPWKHLCQKNDSDGTKRNLGFVCACWCEKPASVWEQISVPFILSKVLYHDRKFYRSHLFEQSCGCSRLTTSLACLSSPYPLLSLSKVKWCHRSTGEECFCGGNTNGNATELCYLFLPLDRTQKVWIGPCSLKQLPYYISLWISHRSTLRKEQGQ